MITVKIHICEQCGYTSSDKEAVEHHEAECMGKEKKTRKKKAEMDFSFVESEYKDSFDKWIEYKRKGGKMYKTQSGLEYAYGNMKKCGDNNQQLVDALVDFVIKMEYQGFFEPSAQKKDDMMKGRVVKNEKFDPNEGDYSSDGKHIFISGQWVQV